MSTTPGSQRHAAVRLSGLLRGSVTDSGGEEAIGRLSDVIVRLREADHPVVTGLVVTVGGRPVFVPVEQVAVLPTLRLTSARLSLLPFERREGEVLLRADVLGHRLIDVESAHLIRAADLELAADGGEWTVTGVDSHRRSRRLLWRLTGTPADEAGVRFREWAKFEPLIGHPGTALSRRQVGRIRRLKPAQIADLLEAASSAEESEILGQVHADPELDADVFEALEEDRASRLLGARTDAEAAQVLARMRADDAADAIAELPQRRRQPVIDLLPPGQRAKVLTLMGFNPTSAGGLMGMDFIAIPATTTVAAALTAVADAASLQPEALTSVHALDAKGRPVRGRPARRPRAGRSAGSPRRDLRPRPGPGRRRRRCGGRGAADERLQPDHDPGG